MQRNKIIIEYDGTSFAGWQKQINSISIQECLEKAIYALSQERSTIFAAGRTDAGVHALGQVAHFDLKKNYPTHTIINALNSHLRPHKIVVIDAKLASMEFHARFSARKRYYRYVINNRFSPLALDKTRCWHIRCDMNIEKMQQAAEFLIGTHDFSSFRAIQCQALSPIKTLNFIKIERYDNIIILDFGAQSFLHHMVRNITGTLKMVGSGQCSIDDFKTILLAKDRRKAGITAPAHGLYFMKVDY